MIIGIPRERKIGETRIALQPRDVGRLIEDGHSVLIETGAGRGSGFEDSNYSDIGAKIEPSLEKLWAASELLLKVKEPSAEERNFFREGLIVFSFLHPAADLDLVQKLLSKKVIGIDFDLVRETDGSFPILSPMSEIAGVLSIYAGFTAIQPANGGRGVLLGGIEGVEPCRVTVIGAGVAGRKAIETALACGANVLAIDLKEGILNELSSLHPSLRTAKSSAQSVKSGVEEADIIVGAVLVPGDKAPKLITEDLLSDCKRGAVIVDICIDQGGFAETSRATSVDSPTYVEQGVVHYCVPNMPALVPRSSTIALSNAVIPYLLKLLSYTSIEEAITSEESLKQALITMDGELRNEVVKKALALY